MLNLTSPSVIKELLNKYNFQFRKRFGQNFLIDSNIVKKIVNAANITSEDTVIEIGPGIGTMTQELAQQAKKVIAVEIDRDLIEILNETLSDFDNIEIINNDILEVDLNELKQENENLKIVANLPYYITTPVIMSLLESDIPVEQMSFLVQKEVADRISGEPGNKDYGALSVIAQYYADVAKQFDVPAGVFMPKPKVDSATLIFKKKEPEDKELNKTNYFKVVKAAFANRRKTLLNTLSNNLGFKKSKIKETLESLNINPGERAENLSSLDFAKITKALYS